MDVFVSRFAHPQVLTHLVLMSGTLIDVFSEFARQQQRLDKSHDISCEMVLECKGSQQAASNVRFLSFTNSLSNTD